QPLPAAARPAPVDRCEHRQPPARGRQHRGGRTDRLRPDPVRRDLRREPHRPVGHQPPGRVLRSQLMSVLAPPLPVRRSRKLARWAPYAVLAGSAAFSAGLLALLTTVTIAGLFALTAVSYAVAITILARVVDGPRWAKDRLATALVTLAFLLALIPLVSLLAIVVGDGMGGFSWDFLSTDMVGVFGSMTSGGALHAIIGTVYVTGIASLVAIPLGIFTAIYLVEYGQGRLKRGITLLVDVMTGIPSIVAGLFAYTVFLVLFGPAYKSALIGGVALAVLMTPGVIRSVEERLRLVPNELRAASVALGVP